MITQTNANPGKRGLGSSFNAVTHDATGNVYAAGWTSSSIFPVLNGVQMNSGGGEDAVAVMFNTSYQRQWATYYGGSGDEVANGVAVDNSGEVFFAGTTTSNGLTPINPGGGAYIQGTLSGGGFIVKLISTGQRVSWSTYYGGEIGGLAMDNTNNYLYAAGFGFSTTLQIQTEAGAYMDADSGGGFISKFTTGGVQKWCTNLGDSASLTSLSGCATDASGNVYVIGSADGYGYPVTPGCFNFTLGSQKMADVVATKFNSSNAMVWSTYYGGDGQDEGYGIAADASGNAYIVGYTYGPWLSNINIQRKNPGGGAFFQRIDSTPYMGGYSTGFIAEFSSDSGALKWGTYFGQQATDMAIQSITIDSRNNLYIGGYAVLYVNAGGLVFPATEPGGYYSTPYPGSFSYAAEALAAFNSNRQETWATYIPSNYNSEAYSITDYNADKLYVVGQADDLGFFANPGNGAWFQDTIGNARTIPCIAEFDVSIATGINNITDDSQNGGLKAYPNPTTENITVQLQSDKEQNIEFILYNVFGEAVYTDNTNEPSGAISKQISLSLLPNATYILKVIANGNVYYAKITKLQ